MITTDDLDGHHGAETVTFGLDGVSYEVDLGQPNQSRLAACRYPTEAGSAPRL